jgi:ABC-type transporter Mla subunit MlaD
MSNYFEPSCFSVSEGDEVTAHDELVRELADFNHRIDELESKLSKALDDIDLLGQAVAVLIKRVDPNFNPNQQ